LGGSGVDDVRILGVPEINFSYILPLISFAYIGIYGLIVFSMLQNKEKASLS
jgi:FHS family L-fucose permease-like MFS transporter